MPFAPLYQLEKRQPTPDFLLRDALGREYGVVEYYGTDRNAPEVMLCEFVAPHIAPSQRPRVFVDLRGWQVVAGEGKNLPEPEFEPAFDLYLRRFDASARETRLERARRARHFDLIGLAEKGFSIAFQELFPEEAKGSDFPEAMLPSVTCIVDDQYSIRPGEFRHGVTLVFMEKGLTDPDQEPFALANWTFGLGWELLHAKADEDAVAVALDKLTRNPELEKIYLGRMKQMRKAGVMLGISPLPHPEAPKS